MKQVSVSISTYTADVSGVCSALYELGGMVVIHDPSGCNSTYNTHDEPRWYEQDSLVFISGLSEMDAIMGNDEKFINDIVRAAKDLHPKFIALVRTPIPMMIGTDFDAIQRILEEETGLPVFYFPTNGMHSYIQGVGMALEKVAERLVEEPKRKKEKAINLLGVTPLDFSVNDTLSSMKKFFKEEGYTIQSTVAMGSAPEEIARAGEASINVVVSSAGLLAAQVLQKRFGIPYVVGMPTGPFKKILKQAIEKSLQDGKSRLAYKKNEKAEQKIKATAEGKTIYFVGEAVTMQSLAVAVSEQYGVEGKVICPLETPEELLMIDDKKNQIVQVESEEEVQELLKQASGIVADPMYRPISPENCPFFSLPHEAFSGRIYRKQIPDLTEISFLDSWMMEILPHRFSRTELLIGKQSLCKLREARVAVFGVGGVGGYVVEALARSGVGQFDLIDNDVVSLTNINRQIIATQDSIGRQKVEVMKERILSINPEAKVNSYPCFYLPEKEEQFDFSAWSYVVDAVDTVTAKIGIVLQAQKANVPVISCMGAGNKLDASRFEVTDIYKTTVCPLARVMRRELKQRGVRHLKVVYSREPAIKTGSSVPGSISFVPSAAGLIAAGEVIKDIIGDSAKR